MARKGPGKKAYISGEFCTFLEGYAARNNMSFQEALNRHLERVIRAQKSTDQLAKTKDGLADMKSILDRIEKVQRIAFLDFAKSLARQKKLIHADDEASALMSEIELRWKDLYRKYPTEGGEHVQ